MQHGMLSAEVQDGPYKGWTFGAAMAIHGGKTPAEVKQAMREAVASARTDLDKWETYIDSLPDTIVIES